MDYDTDGALQLLADERFDLEQADIIALAFAEVAEEKESECIRIRRRIHALTTRLRADGVLPPNDEPPDDEGCTPGGWAKSPT